MSAAVFDPDAIMRAVRAVANPSSPAKTANPLKSGPNFSSLASLVAPAEIGDDGAPPSAPQVEIARPNNRGAHLAEISRDAALPKALKAAVQRWINDHFTPSPPGVCVHCREGTRADDPFILMFVASDRADVHSSCHAAWRAEREAEAMAALDLKESA
jgi:hypothetical protein